MVVRAPKGSTEAVYFPKGSTNQIKAMLGIPTADWPDIQDALDLNGSYGLWISAPPGASTSYPSYFGGTYVTKQGLFPFYKVADRTNPSFQVLVTPEQEDAEFIHTGDPDSIVMPIFKAENSTGKDQIQILNVPSKIIAHSLGIKFDFWGNPAAGAFAGAQTYQLDFIGNNIQVENPDGSGNMITVGSTSFNDSGDAMLTITGTANATAGFLYMNFDLLVDPKPYTDTLGFFLSAEAENTYKALLHNAIAQSVRWVVDVEDSTYMTIAQKTQTEKETVITFNEIGYDKYTYDAALDVYQDQPYHSNPPAGSYQVFPTADLVENSSGVFVQFFTPAYAAAHPTALTGVYQCSSPGNPPVNVTSSYCNKYIRIANAGYKVNNGGRDIVGTEALLDKIYYVDATSQLKLCMTTTAPDGTVPARKAKNFNQISFSVVEDVYPGDATSGGSFTGSLSQTGTDGYGGNIYFPNILPENAVSDVDVAVYKTFDSDVDASGFFTGYHIIDSRLYDQTSGRQYPASATTGNAGLPSVRGQRYITSVVNDLINSGSTGGVVDSRFTTLLIEGWTEAAKDTYEPVPVFAEPTGTEDLKAILYNLRIGTHKMATFVSPKLITPSEAIDPSSIIVNGRVTGTAQIVNQALRSDSFTGAKYWTSLIGAYAAQLLLIIDGKLGGWAPMWTNISGYGGQLPIAVNKMKYQFNQEQLKALDETGLNPIVLDPTYGLMVVSQKTTQDPLNLSDWSYLGHSMAFDLFKRQVRDNVMVAQIGKPNDAYYQAMRQRQVEALLNRRTGSAEPIWAAGKVEVANVNTADVKAQRKFAIRVTVKVNVFSEFVEFVFVNVAQTTSV
jgi:hypothetical protein